jgi:hypothetical protein
MLTLALPCPTAMALTNVVVQWLSDVAMQLYLRKAMRKFYTRE